MSATPIAPPASVPLGGLKEVGVPSLGSSKAPAPSPGPARARARARPPEIENPAVGSLPYFAFFSVQLYTK